MEYTVLEQKSAQVFKLPPRSIGGQKAELWTQQIWTGVLKVVVRPGPDGIEETVIKLISNEGKLFGEAPIQQGNLRSSFERVSDSSRYFVIKLQDRIHSKHAFVGLGFEDRSDAFDLNYVLTQYTTPPQPIENDLLIKHPVSTNQPGEVVQDFSTDDLSAFAELPPPPATTTRHRA